MNGGGYRIFETRQFEEDLKVLVKSGESRIVDRLQELIYPELRETPYFGRNMKKLKGYSPETWRCRIGSWRFFFEIDEEEKTVFMIAASHRGSAY